MYRLGRLAGRGTSSSLYSQLHKPQLKLKTSQQVSVKLQYSARTFCVSVCRPAGTGSKELDELILSSSGDSVSATTAAYVSPLNSTSVVTPPLEPSSPISSITSRAERFVSRYIAKAIYCIVWKHQKISRYLLISRYFFMHDIGQFWPFMDL